MMSETPSEDEAASAEQAASPPSGDDADRGVQLQRCPRVEALEACAVELLRSFDESKCNMDRYYHAFLELETVVNQLRENQNHLTAFVQRMAGAAGAAGAERAERAGAARSARNAKWRGITCPHGRRRYRCRHCAAPGEPDARAEAHAQLAGELRSLKARIAAITRPDAAPAGASAV